MPTDPQDIIQTIYDAVQKAVRVVVLNGSPGGTVELGPDSLAALEEVQVNVTGEGGIATETTLANLLGLLTPGAPEHRNGTVNTTPQQVSFSGVTKYLVVENTSSGNKLEISFDNGVTFMPVIGKSHVAILCRVSNVRVRSSGGNVDYFILAIV